jgi:tetratricopeptide (TPR) repeat protein
LNCPQCGFENPQDAQFCIDCGAPLKSEPKPATVPCPKCRYENKPDSAFCITCGNSLKADKAEPKRDIPSEPGKAREESKPRPGPRKKAAPKPPAQIVCPQCRSENDQDSAFCINCGSSLKPLPAPRPAEPPPVPERKPDRKPQVPSAPQVAVEPKPFVEPKPQVVTPQAPPPPKKEIPPLVPGTDLAETWQRPAPEVPVVEKTSEPSKPGKWLLPVGIAAGLAVICLAVWYFALRPKPSVRPTYRLAIPAEPAPQAAPAPAPADTSSSIPPAEAQAQPPEEKESSTAAVKPEAVPPPPPEKKQTSEAAQPSATPQPATPAAPAKPAAQTTSDISELITLGIEAFQQKDYDACITQMKAALSQDPANRTARRYLVDAENRKKEGGDTTAWLQAAREAYQAGNFEQCLEQTKKILALEPDQPEALRYEEMAHQKLAPQRIKSMVDEFTTAASGGRLASYYESACQPALYQKIKKDMELMNDMYGQFKSQSAQTTVRFLDNGQIEARFSNITTGVLKTDNRKMVIFEGTYVWTLQRRGDRWLIAGLQSQPIRKKT